MAREIYNVWVGTDGRAYVGPTTADEPTTAESTLDTDYDELGWISEDGLTEAANEEFTEVKAWDGTVIRKIRTSSERTFSFSCLETNKAVLDLFYSGSDVTTIGGSGSVLAVESPSAQKKSFVFDVFDGTEVIRYYIPNGEVSERGDQTVGASDAISYSFTITCYPDTNGVTIKKFFTNDYSS